MKGNKGFMAVKVDLEKAYDKMNWNFLRETLQEIGLKLSIIDLIWNHISTPYMHVLWNRKALDSFLSLKRC